MKSLAASNYWFRLLFNVVRLVLIMPHSNAGIERVYALVKKNKAEGTDRNRLDIKESLSSIFTGKLARPEAFFKCYDENFCMMLKMQQESITRRTLQFLQMSQHCQKHYFLTLCWLKTAMYKTRNTGTGSGMRGTRGMGGMLYSVECRQTFREMLPNIPENVAKHSFKGNSLIYFIFIYPRTQKKNENRYTK